MWTWWVSRSRSAPVRRSEPKVLVHSSNDTAKVENKARAALERFGVKELIAQPIN
jgi:hypothetical protein